MNSQEKTFSLLGINDDESTCTLCGRKELKAVYWLENLATGEVFHVGTTCGPRLLRCTKKEFVAFEKTEIANANRDAQTWFSAHQEIKAYRAKLDELSDLRLSWEERKPLIMPLHDAVSALEKEAKVLFPLYTRALAWI